MNDEQDTVGIEPLTDTAIKEWVKRASEEQLAKWEAMIRDRRIAMLVADVTTQVRRNDIASRSESVEFIEKKIEAFLEKSS